MTSSLLRIAILGPESTGKSTLAEALAHHYDTVWVPEFARTYLSSRSRTYTEEDVWFCARRQQQEEARLVATARRMIFLDTDMINFKIWLDVKYGNHPKWITDGLSSRYDFYLLTSPDLPFEPDPLREHPDLREHFFDVYRQEIETAGFPYAIVHGIGPQRLANAVRWVEELLSKNFLTQ